MSDVGPASDHDTDAQRLQALVRTCLPVGATLGPLERKGDRLVASFNDHTGLQHTIEWWDAALERPAYRRGDRLAFAYRIDPPGAGGGVLDAAAIDAMLAVEVQLFALSSVFAALRPSGSTGRLAFLRETDLALRIARALPRAGSMRRAATAVLETELARGAPVSEVHLYFENRCTQSCEFCEEPLLRGQPVHRLASGLLRLQQRASLDLVSAGPFDAILDVLWSRPEPIPLTITGHDWLLHPRLETLLRALEKASRARLRLQGPSLALESAALAQRVAKLPGLEWVATTLQSADAAEHDAMVGSKGAHARLVEALARLSALGVTVRLTLVLTRRAVRTLADTLHWLRERNLSVLASAFIPDEAMGDASDRLAYLDDVRAALEAAGPLAGPPVRAFVGVPLCAIPAAFRHKAVRAIHTAERAAPVFAAACSRCAARASCPGLPPLYLDVFGARGIEPL